MQRNERRQITLGDFGSRQVHSTTHYKRICLGYFFFFYFRVLQPLPTLFSDGQFWLPKWWEQRQFVSYFSKIILLCDRFLSDLFTQQKSCSRTKELQMKLVENSKTLNALTSGLLGFVANCTQESRMAHVVCN